MVALGGPGVVGGQRQRDQVGELPGPETQILGEGLVGEPAALPGGVVGVVKRSHGQFGPLAAGERRVAGRELALEDGR